MTRHFLTALAALASLSACGELPTGALAPSEPEVSRSLGAAPPGADPGSCWGKYVTPATIETVTEHVLLQPAEIGVDGTIRSTPVYKTETKQVIVEERRELWFETPCATDMTPDFVASVQRALAARGLYRGPITGEMDSRTRRAVRAYQEPQGVPTGILSLAAARKLGLVGVDLPVEDDDGTTPAEIPDSAAL